MSPAVKRSLAGIATAVSVGAVIVGAGYQLLGFPAWSLWGIAASISLMWLSIRPRTAPWFIGIAVAVGALYFGLPFILGSIAKGIFR